MESSNSVEMVRDDAQLLQRKVFPCVCLATSKHSITHSVFFYILHCKFIYFYRHCLPYVKFLWKNL